MTDTTPTPAETLKNATHKDVMLLEGLSLVGTFVGFRDARALIRFGDGRIEKVSVGDKLGFRQVTAIEDGVLILGQNGETARRTIAAAG